MKFKGDSEIEPEISVGKYVLETWMSGNYTSRHLRLITREDKKFYYADVQRDCVDYENSIYVFDKNWARKYVKDKTNKQGFKRSINRLSNTDGVMTYRILNSPAEAQCTMSFKEIFDYDLREIQNENDSPLYYLKSIDKLNKLEKNNNYVQNYKLRITETINGWDEVLKTRLKELFNVVSVHSPEFKIHEVKKRTVMSTSGTLFHLNDFFLDKEKINFDENYFNRTIMFWLFKDRLIFQYENGKACW